MARDIFCDTGGCQHKADFILTVLSTGQTSAFCSHHFAAVSETSIREFEASPPRSELEQSVTPDIDPQRIPLVAAVASEIADIIWSTGRGLEPEDLIARNLAGWSVTVPVYEDGGMSTGESMELNNITLSPAELTCAAGIVADALADRVPLPDVPAVEVHELAAAVTPDAPTVSPKSKRSKAERE